MNSLKKYNDNFENVEEQCDVRQELCSVYCTLAHLGNYIFVYLENAYSQTKVLRSVNKLRNLITNVFLLYKHICKIMVELTLST